MVGIVVKAAEDGSWQAATAWLELRRPVWRMGKPSEPKRQDLSVKSEEELVAAVEQWLAQKKQRVE